MALAVVLLSTGVAAGQARATEGVPDASFGTGGVAAFDLPAYDPHRPGAGGSEFSGIAVAPSGRIYAVGTSDDSGGQFYVLTARILENGFLDPSYDSTGSLISEPFDEKEGQGIIEDAHAMLLEADESLIAEGDVIERVTPAGEVDKSYGPYRSAMHVQLLRRLNDGDALGAGYAQTEEQVQQAILEARLPDGARDERFGNGGLVMLPAYPGARSAMAATGLLQLADGDLLVAGNGHYWAANGREMPGIAWIARLSESGVLDPSFGSDGIRFIEPSDGEGAVLLTPRKGGVAMVDSVSAGSESPAQTAVWGLTPEGVPDPSFGTGGEVTLPATAGYESLIPLAATTDAAGRVVVAGELGHHDQPGPSMERPEVVRVEGNGLLDASFGEHGVALGALGARFLALTTDPRGRILASGELAQEADRNPNMDALIERFAGTPGPFPDSQPQPASDQRVLAAIARQLAAELKGLGHCASRTWLLRHHRCRLALTASGTTRLTARWTVQTRHRRGRHLVTERVTIASGHATLSANTRSYLTLNLTSAGVAFLRRHRDKLRITITDTLVSGSDRQAHASLAFWLKPG